MFSLDYEQKVKDLNNGVVRTVLLSTGKMSVVLNQFEKGAEGSMHSHPHEQATYVLSGSFEFTIDGVTKIVHKGDVLHKNPGIMHGCVCLEKGELLDVFTPQREDFLQD